ncbi:MAG: hypothetical protein ACT4PU_13105 [Planctomycetota bacterium]
MSFLTPEHWRAGVAIATFFAAVHAYRKLNPYFAATWFGSGLVLGWFWAGERTAPEALLLPILVIYLAAAITKGVVEQGFFSGNHLVHVLATGLFAGLIAWPIEAAALGMGWTLPRDPPFYTALVSTPLDGPWMAGVPVLMLVIWSVLATLYYGIYKLLDHIGLGSTLQTLLLFAAMPFMPWAVSGVMSWMS